MENVATAANKPGWVMQSDILSPLAPVTSVRSDTFIIRVMGEPKRTNSRKIPAKAWIELTVQRTPDYVNHIWMPPPSPAQPFEDRNLNGYWDIYVSEHCRFEPKMEFNERFKKRQPTRPTEKVTARI